jgi:hypothetical protein
MRGSRTVSTIACASVQASWTVGTCSLNMFLNMVDTLVGGGSLSNSQSRPRPSAAGRRFLLYTRYVRPATQFDALKGAQAIPCLNNRQSGVGSKPVLPSRKPDFRNTSESTHSKCSLACLNSANNGSNQTSSRSHTLDNARGRRQTKRHERHRVSRNAPLIQYRYLFLNLLHRPDLVLGLSAG